MELEIAKGGTTQMTASLMRSSKGLTIRVKVSPQVEEFIRSLGTGDSMKVTDIGRFWENDNPETALRVYDLRGDTNMLGPLNIIGTEKFYRLDRPGSKLIEADPDSGRLSMINLSFIRLLGASEGEGITLNIRGVHTTEAVRELRDSISQAFVSFYSAFMKPLNLSVMVSTQEM